MTSSRSQPGYEPVGPSVDAKPSAALDDTDRAILAEIGGGLRTWIISRKLRLPGAVVRRRLNRLAATGWVRRSERYSAVNDIYWVLAGSEIH